MLLVGTGELYGQVVIQSLAPFELEFTDVSHSGDPAHLRVNPVSESSLPVLSALFPLEVLPPLVTGSPDGSGDYFTLRRDDLYIGYRPGEAPGGTFLTFTITNRSNTYIDQYRLSLDLAFQNRGERSVRLYRSVQLEPESGFSQEELFFDTGSLGDGGEAWETAGLNFLLQNLMMSPGDTIRVSFQWRSDPASGEADGIAIQRLEIEPVEHRFEQRLGMGDLVITEILPSLDVDGLPYQYIEIYNPTMQTVDLRGVELQAGGRMYRIRESLTVEPYGMSLIANRNLPESGISADYLIESLHIPNHGGIIELSRGGQRLIRAAYDERNGRASWELQQVIAANNGYLSIREFQPSARRIDANLNGTPGEAGTTERIFQYRPDRPGEWNLLSVPGRLVQETGTGTQYRFATDRSDPIYPAGQSFLSRGPSDYVVTARENRSPAELLVGLNGDSEWQFLGNPFLQEMQMSQVRSVGGELAGRTGQVWDPVTRSFRLTTRQFDTILPWQGFLIRNRDAEAVEYLPEAPVDESPEYDRRERYIAFELSGSNQQQAFFDEAAVLYFRGNSPAEPVRYEAEKLWPFFSGSYQQAQASLLYFQRETSGGSRYLAQQAHLYQPDAPFEVRLGHLSLNTGGTFTIEWPEWINIPESWEFTLIDHQTGSEIDMKQHESYRFESQPFQVESAGPDQQEPGIRPLSGLPSGNRFSIRVNPGISNIVEETSNEESLDEVELYRNYPNPFSNSTTIHFYVPENQIVSVSLYNVVGQRVAQLLEDAPMSAGEHEIVWNAGDIPSGMYILHLEAGSTVFTRKITIIK